MNELDLVKQLRDDVPAPSSAAWSQARAAIAAAEAHDEQAAPGGAGLWGLPRRRAALGTSAIGVLAATGALLATAPWSSSPDFLAQAAAALTPDAGTVLHESWEATAAPQDRNNPEDTKAFATGPDQLWIEAGAKPRYRALVEPRSYGSGSPAGIGGRYTVDTVYTSESTEGDFSERLALALKGQPLEIGGTLTTKGGTGSGEIPQSLTFVPPDELWSANMLVSLGPPLPGPEAEIDDNVADPVSELRTALAEGRAHEAGTTQLEGRTVERIDFDPPAAGTPTNLVDPQYVYSHSYAYVEPETFHPVEIVLNGSYYRVLAYEYLPATTANLELANIEAQHPNATIAPEGRAPTEASAG
ncbi:MAG TPA: hypothetical protein VGF95_16465 [Solirubrobacteraceae bacterium]